MHLRTLAAAIAVLLAVSGAPRARAFTLVVGDPDTPLVPNSVIELAGKLGYFKREGIDVQIKHVTGTPLAIAALLAGQADMANISLEALLKVTARGEASLRAVGSPSKSLFYLIAARQPISSIAELAGKSFGIGQVGTLDDTLTRHVLQRGGVDPATLQMVSVGRPQARLKALVAGKIDATTVSYGTWMTLPNKAGLQIIVPKEDYFRAAPMIAKVDVVSQATLASKRVEVVKVTTALIKLSRAFAKHPQLWADVMSKERPQVPKATLQQLASAYAGDWSVNGGLNVEQARRSAEFLYRSPVMAGLKRIAVSQWTDLSVIRDAIDTLSSTVAKRRSH